VTGIGEKTAAALAARYGDLDAIRAAAHDRSSDLSPAVRRRLLEADDYLEVSMTVVAVVRDAALPVVDDVLPRTPPDHARVMATAQRWGLDAPISRVVTAMAGP
jgi:5'-3' exonuclease